MTTSEKNILIGVFMELNLYADKSIVITNAFGTPEHVDDTLEGIQLYSRQITSFTTLAALTPINDLLKSLRENVSNEKGKDSILRSLEEYVVAAMKNASENIDLTTEHLREYFEIQDIDFTKTPYA